MREHFYSTYIVASRTHTIYVGMTNDLFHHGPGRQVHRRRQMLSLAAPAGRAAAHATVAASISYHDGSAGLAAWSVSHIVETLHRIGGMIDAAVFDVKFATGLADCSEFGEDSSLWGRGCAHAPGGFVLVGGETQILRRGFCFARNSTLGRGRGCQSGEKWQLLAGEEAQLHPAEDVIHDGLGIADLLVAGPA